MAHPFLRPQPLLPETKCSTGCPQIDRFLAGGIPQKSITEIFGESGLGKTQLCLQTSLEAAVRGSSAIYIHTDFSFPYQRLKQIAENMAGSWSTTPEELSNQLCSRVSVRTTSTANELMQELDKAHNELAEKLNTCPVKIIVVDSVASVFRSQFNHNPADMSARMNFFFKIATKLKSISHKFNLAVLLTNQVADYFGGGKSTHSFRIGNLPGMWSSGRQVVAALGMSWANCVTTRLFFAREADSALDPEGGRPIVVNYRRLHVILSPNLPPSSIKYVIEGEGLRGVQYTN